MNLHISLCIPTINRWNFLKTNLPKYLNNKYISEIVISDENGNDIKLIQENFNDSKLKLFQNDSILGALKNKEKVVSLASNDIVCLMDSDNFADIDYFEFWISYVQNNGLNLNTVYCPEKASPHFTYSIEYIINKNNFKELYKKHLCDALLNTGNYIINKKFYISSVVTDSTLLDYDPVCNDVIFKNYWIIQNNGTLVVVPNMSYQHIVHDGSYWMKNHNKFDANPCFNLYK